MTAKEGNNYQNHECPHQNSNPSSDVECFSLDQRGEPTSHQIDQY